jgi:hypothetical protein
MIVPLAGFFQFSQMPPMPNGLPSALAKSPDGLLAGPTEHWFLYLVAVPRADEDVFRSSA